MPAYKVPVQLVYRDPTTEITLDAATPEHALERIKKENHTAWGTKT